MGYTVRKGKVQVSLLILWLTLSFNSYAQPYLTNANQWMNTYSYFANGNPPYSYTYSFYYVKGDSLYNNTSYKKIYLVTKNCGLAIWQPTQPEPCPGISPVSSFVGLLREAGQRWYFKPSSGSEALLYRFDLIKGDTVRDFNSLNYVVIDSVITNYNGTGLKLFRVPRAWSGYGGFIEGIGPTCGFLSKFSYFNPFESESDLDCYVSSITQTPGCGNWHRITSLPDRIVSEQNSRNVYPNPASSLLNLPHDIESITRIRIYNVEGKIILQTDKMPLTQTLDISLFARGFYYLEMVTNNNTEKYKFIKE